MKQAEKQQMESCYKLYGIQDTLLKILEIYKIDQHIQRFLSATMRSLRNITYLRRNEQFIRTDVIKINRLIFQCSFKDRTTGTGVEFGAEKC